MTSHLMTTPNTHWPQPRIWQPSPSPSTSSHRLLPSTATKRKLIPDEDDRPSSALSSTSSSKRQRRCRSHSSLSDSEEDECPPTPKTNLDAAAIVEDAMDWTATATSSSSELSSPPWRQTSPGAFSIHHLELLRPARPPTIATTSPIPMRMQVTEDQYVFEVDLPGYNIDNITVSCKRGNVVSIIADLWHLPRSSCHAYDISFDTDVQTSELRASMDKRTRTLTLRARRCRRFVPIEVKVARREKDKP